MHFCSCLCTPGETSRSITHPEIASGQTRLTPEFFTGELLEKKVYLDDMSILSILLNIETGCHNPPLRRPTSSSVNSKPETFHLGHVRTSSTIIYVPYVQLAACIPYCVPHRGLTRYAYVPTSLTRTSSYPSQLTRTRS
jgi:hypothetical protein